METKIKTRHSFETTLTTTGPAVEADITELRLAKWLKQQGFSAQLVIAREDGGELTEDDKRRIIGLIAAASDKPAA